MNMYLIIMEVKCGAIDADDSSCHFYYINKFSLSPYNLQSDLSIDSQVIYPDELIHEGTYFFRMNISSHYYVLQKNPIT